MYGLVFEVVEEFVIEKQGHDVWREIKAKAGCEVEDQTFLRRSYYTDSEFFDIIVAASEVLGVALPDILEALGHFMIRHHYLNGYNDLLRAQGATLRQWMSNLNAMHDHIQKSFPGKEFQAPIFWCEDCEEVEGSILLHYYSMRGVFLVPMVVGICEEIASFQFDVEVRLTQLALQGENGAEFTSWRMTATDPSQQWKLSPRASPMTPEEFQHCWKEDDDVDFTKMEMPSKCPFTGAGLSAPSDGIKSGTGKCPYSSTASASSSTTETASLSSCLSSNMSPGLSLSNMQNVFPFHILVNKNFTMLQVGESLPSLMHMDVEEFSGRHIGEVLNITRPLLGSSWDWKALKKLDDQHFFLAPTSTAGTLKKRVSMKDTRVRFKASMIRIANDSVMFTLSPDARNVEELRDMGLTLTDLPLHGCQRDAVFLGEYIVQEVDKAHALDKLSKSLEKEKNLSNTLLYNMLPKNVADDLRSGKTVEPKQYDNVTLFFSDIVGFTSICDKVCPWSVIDLLNQLYQCMDHLASHFNLYKVETIGDAYMCCSGLPIPDDNHAENIANFALAVKECVKHVKSPLDGSPINLRIGIHTGSCTAGVVGTLTPHFNLFGDLVNTAARHEQTGVAGMIQCSSDLFGRLKHFSKYEKEQFTLTPRGLVDMKGKGQSYTYWLESATTDNKHTGPDALQNIYKEVGEMLEKKNWKMRRYFGRGGNLRGDTDSQSVSSESTVRTSPTIFRDSDHELSHSLRDSILEVISDEEETMDNTDRNLNDLDDILDAANDPASEVGHGLVKLVWDNTLSREDFVSNIHHLLSPLLKLCLFDETTASFPVTADLADAQLHGFIDRISKTFKQQNPYHNFCHTAHVVAWANYLFEQVQDSGAGQSGAVDNGPWFRFALAMAALVRDCKHSGVSDGQLQVEHNVVYELYGGDNCQAKHALNYGLDVLSEEFPVLYEEVVWGCPRFVHLMRKTALSTDYVAAFEKAMQVDGNTPRAVLQRTEATMGILMGMANMGHFALNLDSCVEWSEAACAEKRLASMAKRGCDPSPNWHEHFVKFFKQNVFPLADLCDTVLPKAACLVDSVSLNLTHFLAQGKPWADNRILVCCSLQDENPQSVNPAFIMDVFG